MTSVEIALNFSLRNTRDIPSRSNSNGINNIDLQLIDRHQSTLCRTNQELRLPTYEVSQKNNDIGQAYFFSLLPLPLSFFLPRTYPKGYYFYSPQSSTVVKSKMAATTTSPPNTNKVSPTQNTPALQATVAQAITVCYPPYRR